MNFVYDYLQSDCGREEIIGPYPCELSYNSNNGAATSLQFLGTANKAKKCENIYAIIFMLQYENIFL